jgi:hypothetical protein
MASRVLRILGAVAGVGSAALFWFIGNALAGPIRKGELLRLGRNGYELLAFLFVPALILAVVALSWVPPREAGAPAARGMPLRAILTGLFVAAFVIGVAVKV